MFKLNKQLIDSLEEADFKVVENSTYVELCKYSPAGRDFSFSIDYGNTKEEFFENMKSYFEEFDPSEEAYIWLGSDGHGSNGAPDTMGEVYEDSLECENIIEDACRITSKCLFGKDKMPVKIKKPNPTDIVELEKVIAYYVEKLLGEAKQ